MSKRISIYCDESSHLENDQNTIMGLGALSCPTEKKDEIFSRIRDFKLKHGLKKDFEIKWTKVSKGKLNFYIDLVDFFFDIEDLKFRSIIIDKATLDHSVNDGSHDQFHFKMNFILIKQLLDNSKKYKIYLDKKATNGKRKIETLHEYLCNNQYDFNKEIVLSVQEVVSDQVELVQLCDLLLGAVCYANRGLQTSTGKLAVIRRIQKRSGYILTKSTLPSETKMNVFKWIGSHKIEEHG